MSSWRVPLAALPVFALSFAVPLVNRVEPRVLGLPFILFWIVTWVLLTPVCLWGVWRLEKRR